MFAACVADQEFLKESVIAREMLISVADVVNQNLLDVITYAIRMQWKMFAVCVVDQEFLKESVIAREMLILVADVDFQDLLDAIVYAIRMQWTMFVACAVVREFLKENVIAREMLTTDADVDFQEFLTELAIVMETLTMGAGVEKNAKNASTIMVILDVTDLNTTGIVTHRSLEL